MRITVTRSAASGASRSPSHCRNRCAPIGRCIVVLGDGFWGCDEFCNRYAATTHASPVKFDSGDFMQRLGSEVTRSTVRAAQNGNSFDDEQRGILSVAACYFPNLEPAFPAVLATILIPVIPHTLSGYIRSCWRRQTLRQLTVSYRRLPRLKSPTSTLPFRFPFDARRSGR